jgi:sugar/nucleoside kinase (ribokinase family)
MGCVGKDNFSEILAEKAKSDGVDVRYQVTDKESTGSYQVSMIGN